MVQQEGKMAAEKNFENKIKAILKRYGCWYVKYWGGGKFTKDGVPDLIICCNGRFVGCEVKAENGTATEIQKHTLNKIYISGGYAVLLYPKDFEAFTLLIDALSAEPVNDKAAEDIYRKHFERKGW